MRIIIISCIMLFCTPFWAQNETNDEIVEIACDCIDEVEVSLVLTERYEAVQSCISSAILQFQIEHSLINSVQKAMDSIEGIESSTVADSVIIASEKNITIVLDKDYEQIEETLLRECEAMKVVMMNDSDVSDNSISNNDLAIDYYNSGQEYYRNKRFSDAIEAYQKAVDADKNFAFAWDMLGLSYRKTGDFKAAIRSYKMSLKIEPGGRVPLMNIPIAYEYLKKYKKAISSYEDFIKQFPEDPEGYYGIGRMYHLVGDLENALDQTMKAFTMYNELKSPYARDAENNLSIYYKELEAENQLELFTRMAKKHNITID